MLTPLFELDQTESTLIITVTAPYCNVRETEISVEDNVFIFYGTPYYLRLHLPGNILENKQTKTAFDADTGQFTFVFEKSIPGEHFADLHLITKFLCEKVDVADDSSSSKEKITVLTSGDRREIVETLDNGDEDQQYQYGFRLREAKKFKHISAEFRDVFDIDPRETSLIDRRKLRVQQEQKQFNADHYFCDYIENEEILEIMALESPWSRCTADDISFTADESHFLKNLSNYQYQLTDEQVDYCHCSLIDLLYAYCYDRRTTFYEGCSESGWNINKVSATLSWLEIFKSPKQAIVTSFRRSLIYPLYRNYDLSQTIFRDLIQLLSLGESCIIKCLIEMHHIFMQGQCCRYILNNLFIDDYIVYVQKWDKEKWKTTVASLERIHIRKTDLGLNLADIEESTSSELAKMAQLTIVNADSDDDIDDDNTGDS